MSFPLFIFKPTQKIGTSSSCGKNFRHTVGKMDAKKLKSKAQDAFDASADNKSNVIIKPLTRDNLLYYYIPALGTASYTFLSINVLNPSLRCSFFTKRDLTNILLATSLFGTGCYLYSRPHIDKGTKNAKYGFSTLGSAMFNFSSVLFWAILRSLLPENMAVCSAAGLASSYILYRGATNYIEFVDSQISK